MNGPVQLDECAALLSWAEGSVCAAKREILC